MTRPSTYHRPAIGARHSTCNLTIKCNLFQDVDNPSAVTSWPNITKTCIFIADNAVTSDLITLATDGITLIGNANAFPVANRNLPYGSWTVAPLNKYIRFNPANPVNYSKYKNEFTGDLADIPLPIEAAFNVSNLSGTLPNNVYRACNGDFPNTTSNIIFPLRRPNSIDGLTTNQLKAYPNPFGDKLILEVEEGAIGNISIVNLTGQTLLKASSAESKLELADLRDLPAGIYVIRFIDRGEQLKLIKQ